jgi:hypothetical protein
VFSTKRHFPHHADVLTSQMAVVGYKCSERAPASRRVAELDARLPEIKTEKPTLLQGLGERSKSKAAASPRAAPKLTPRRAIGALRTR